MKIAIFIARGNSRRIKNKNIKLFNGLPILEKTYKLISSFKIFDKIFLSTDSPKIINLAKNLKFDEVIKRPKKLGLNNVSTIEVINHSIEILKKKYDFKYISCIYPCSILVEKKTILYSFKKIRKTNDFVFPILEYPEPIEQSFKIVNKDKLKYIYPKYSKQGTEKFKKKYYDAGQFYTSTIKGWKISNKNFKGIPLKKYSTVDIDDIDDWDFANYLYIKKNGKNKKK